MAHDGSMRREVEALRDLGPLPDEMSDRDEVLLDKQIPLLDAIRLEPPSPDEIKVLCRLFPGDGESAYGVAWTLVHIIEAGASWPDASHLALVQPDWRTILEDRLDQATG